MYIKEMPSPSPFNISPAVLYDSAYKIQAPILKNKTRKIVINVIFLISFPVTSPNFIDFSFAFSYLQAKSTSYLPYLQRLSSSKFCGTF